MKIPQLFRPVPFELVHNFFEAERVAREQGFDDLRDAHDEALGKARAKRKVALQQASTKPGMTRATLEEEEIAKAKAHTAYEDDLYAAKEAFVAAVAERLKP